MTKVLKEMLVMTGSFKDSKFNMTIEVVMQKLK